MNMIQRIEARKLSDVANLSDEVGIYFVTFAEWVAIRVLISAARKESCYAQATGEVVRALSAIDKDRDGE